MTDLPSCRQCRTDEHLEYSRYVPATTRAIRRGRVTKNVPQPPEVDWVCTACGMRDGGAVPLEWRPPGA